MCCPLTKNWMLTEQKERTANKQLPRKMESNETKVW